MDLLKYSDVLYSNGYKLTKNREDTEDLVQDTFIMALTKKHLYKDMDNKSLKDWLCVIEKNLYINKYRKEKGTLILKTKYKEKIYSKLIVQPINLDLKNLKEELNNFVENKLSLKRRECFKLYLEGYQYNEIAEKLNIDMCAVQARIHLTKLILKNKFKKYGN